MQRRLVLLLAVAALLAMPVLASAAVTVTATDHVFPVGGGSATLDVLVVSDAGEGINSLDLDVVVNNNAGGGPTITGINQVSAPTLWTASPATFAAAVGPPGTEIFNSTFLNSTSVDVPLNGILAQVTIDTTGLAPGTYPWTVNFAQPNFAPTVMFSINGEILPTYIDGTLTVPVPEPSSIALGLFAAAGMAAVVIRRRRAA